MSRQALATLAVVALLAGCGRDPTQQVLHVRVEITGEQLSGDARPDGARTAPPGHDGQESHATIKLSFEVPVKVSRPGEPFLLQASATGLPLFEGDARLTDKTDWMNVDASQAIRTDMAAHWPHGTPATAPGASVRAGATSIVGGGLEAEVDADLLLAGKALETRTGMGHLFEGAPGSPWPDCVLTTTQARCKVALRLSTQDDIAMQPPPPAGAPPVDSDPNADRPIVWQRDVPDMQVHWLRDGHFVAHADSRRESRSGEAHGVIRVVMWTSAPGESREPYWAP